MQHANLVVSAKYFDPVASVLKKNQDTVLHGVNNITMQLPVKAQVLLPNYVRIKEQQCCLSTCFIKHTVRYGSKSGVQTDSTVCKISRRQNFISLHFTCFIHFMFEFPCIITLYYIKNQQDATLAAMFLSHCKITLHVSNSFCVHHQEY